MPLGRTRVALTVVAVLVWLAAPRPASADASTECLVGVLDRRGVALAPNSDRRNHVACRDGDPCDHDRRVDGRCRFRLRGCVNVPEEGCEPRPIRKAVFKLEKHARSGYSTVGLPELDSASAAFVCSREVRLTVRASPSWKGADRRRILAYAKTARPFRGGDKDRFRLHCETCPAPGPDGRCRPPESVCASCDDPTSGPERVVLTVGARGGDLDAGWTGSSHNFRPVPGARIGLCTTRCDGTGDTTCDVCGEIGAGTVNGDTFGPPMPLLANNVPLCVVNRWRDAIRGTMDEATGETSLDVKLFSDVYLTSRDNVCPQCVQGKCDAASGGNAGKDCVVEASVPVFVSPQRTDGYDLSSTCSYTIAPTATLEIDLAPLTSGTTVPLVGPTPCTRQAGEPIGVPPQADVCQGSGCGSTCTGLACVSTIDDPTNPGTEICVDAKGGISRLCCNGNTSRPCHDLANGGTLTRTGLAGVPQPPLPDPTYPRTQEAVLASTFCIPATGYDTIDSVTGFPGPGAIELPVTAEWLQD